MNSVYRSTIKIISVYYQKESKMQTHYIFSLNEHVEIWNKFPVRVSLIKEKSKDRRSFNEYSI